MKTTEKIKGANARKKVETNNTIVLFEDKAQTNETRNVSEIKIIATKQIKISDEYVLKGNSKGQALKNFDNESAILICCALLENGQVVGIKKDSIDIKTIDLSKTKDKVTLTSELSEIKAFRSLVLISESKANKLDKIDNFDKVEATTIQKLNHIKDKTTFGQMGLNKALKVYLTECKGILSAKQLSFLNFKDIITYIESSRFRYNGLYTYAQISTICNEILKRMCPKVKVENKVKRQGGTMGKKANLITSIAKK